MISKGLGNLAQPGTVRANLYRNQASMRARIISNNPDPIQIRIITEGKKQIITVCASADKVQSRPVASAFAARLRLQLSEAGPRSKIV